MSIILGILFVLLAVFLQSSILQIVSLAGVIPNLVVILVVSFSYMRGRKYGMFLGFFAGLLLDCLTGGLLGVQSFILLFLGFLAGYVHRIYVREDYTLSLVLIGAGDVLYNMLFYTFEFLLRSRLSLGTYFLTLMLPELVYTLLVSIILYYLLAKVNDFLVKLEYKEE